MKKTIKSLFVAFNDSSSGGLKQGITNSLEGLKHNKDYKVVKLEYELSCGDVSNVPFSNADVYEDFFFNTAENAYVWVQDSIKTIHSYNKKTTIELFVNKNRANELCNFYYFINVFNDLENVYLNYYHEETKEVYWKKFDEKVFGTQIVVDKRETLTSELIKTFSSKWQELVQNNKAIRECKDGTIIEYSLEQAQALVLPVFNNEYKRFPILYTNFIDKYDSLGIFINYIPFQYVIKTLIEEGLVERTMKTDTQSGCSDIYYEQDFRLKSGRKSCKEK